MTDNIELETSCLVGTGVCFPGVERLRCDDADHSPPCSAEVTIEWSCISILPCSCMVCMRITSPLLYPYAEEICWGEEWMQLADDQVWLLGNVVIKLRVL